MSLKEHTFPVESTSQPPLDRPKTDATQTGEPSPTPTPSYFHVHPIDTTMQAI